MASLIEDLMHILEEEKGCYQLLLEMADNKRDVIIKGEIPSLQDMTQQEQELAGLLLRLERKRLSTVKDICLVTNKASQDMTIKQLIVLLEGQTEAKEQLQRVADELSEMVHQVQEVNLQNKQLLKQSLEFVEFTMNAIQTGREPVSTNRYQSKGQAYNPSASNNFFDAKQ